MLQLYFGQDAWVIDPLPDFLDRVDIAQGWAEALGLAVQKRGGGLGGG
jgi:hypothetical protein